MSWSGEEKVGALFLALWVFGIALSLGVTGLLIWGFIRLVLKYT